MTAQKPSPAPRPWTDADDHELARLLDEGHPAFHIAAELGRSEGAVHGRARRLGRPPPAQAYRRWSTDEDAQLGAMLAAGADSAALEEALGRSRGAILSRARTLGLTPLQSDG